MEVTLRTDVRRGRADGIARFWLALLAFVGLITIARELDSPWLLLLSAVFAAPEAWRNRTRMRQVVASAEGLRLGDQLVPRSALVNALAWFDGRQNWLRLESRDDVVEIAVPTEERAREIVRALGLGEAKALEVRMLTARWFSDGYWVFVAPVAVLVSGVAAIVFPTHIGAIFSTLLATSFALAFADVVVRRRDVVVGIDGVSITDRPRRTQFIPHATITAVRAEGRFVFLELLHAKAVRLDAVAPARGRSSARAEQLAAAIERARTEQAPNAEPASMVDALGAGAFRQSEVPDEILWDALENPRTRISDRVLATAALRQRVSEDDVPRLRVAIDRCASPARERLRAVLDEETEPIVGDADAAGVERG